MGVTLRRSRQLGTIVFAQSLNKHDDKLSTHVFINLNAGYGRYNSYMNEFDVNEWI